MKKRKRVETSDNLFSEFDAAVKKMNEEWEEGIGNLFRPLSLPPVPELTFPIFPC